MTDTSTPHTIVIAGASGMIGSALTTALRERGHHVIQLTRQRTGRTQTGQGVDTVTWDPARGFVPQKVIDRADAVINLAGASIGDRRWDKAYKKKILHSRSVLPQPSPEPLHDPTLPHRSYSKHPQQVFTGSRNILWTRSRFQAPRFLPQCAVRGKRRQNQR